MTMRRLLEKVLACASLVASLAAVTCAQSAFQDAKGESSVFIREGGGFSRINPTDKSIDIGYLRDRGDERWYYGVDAKGKVSGDFAALFSGRTPSPEAELGFTFGKRFLTTQPDARIIEGCVANKAEGLTKNPDDKAAFVKAARDEFIANYKEKRTPEILKQLTAKAEAIRRAFAGDAQSVGVPDNLAQGVADAISPEAIKARAERMAEEEAIKQLQEQEKLDPNASEALAQGKALGDAVALCAREEQKLERRRTLDWLSFRVTYRRGSYKILNTAGAFADQVRKQNFDGYSAAVAYNTLLTLDDVKALRLRREAREKARISKQAAPRESALESKGSVILGVSLGVKRTNNADDLKATDVEDEIFTSTSGTTERRALSKQAVLRGDYKEYIAVPLNTDVVWYPGRFKSRLAVDIFTRSDLGSTGRGFVPGVGFFLTKEGKPTKVVGGFSLAYEDGKARLGLVSGFHF